MIFWDTSAVVPLLVSEPMTGTALELLGGDREMIVWWATPIECRSAIARRVRDHALSEDDQTEAERLLDRLAGSWAEVLATSEVRGHAVRLIRRHPLRAEDALQLAAAMTWTEGKADRHGFACLDDRLSRAARLEGFATRLL